ncbi:MAG: hypothetical protein LBT04_07025 [Prevotellaceae bacterium]|jgi:hypothetical protein|nr:hypothetical protein [Prevotellaceae bacterium]
MKNTHIFVCLGALILLVSCATPMSLYKKGEYYRATLEAVKKLRSKPDDINVQQILKDAYPKAQQASLRIINGLQYSQDPNKYYSIVNQYNNLNTLANEIYRCLKANQLIPNPVDYNDELSVAKQAGAEEFYQLGINTLANGDVRSARLALNYFNNVNGFVPDYKDVNQLIFKAKEQSILQVVVRKPLTNRSYQLSSDFFFDNLMGELRNVTHNKKVVFFEQGQTTNLTTSHQIILLDFVDFTVGNSRELQKVTNCKKDSVIVGYTNVHGTKYPAYGTVRATYTQHTLEVLSAGILNVQIIDFSTNKVVRQQKFTGEYLWTTVWGTYQGDERALNSKLEQMCRRRIETPPPPQDLFVEFTKPIFSKTVSFLDSYYKNY